MARMVELIRDGTAPRSMVRRAAKGELALPAGESIEILVALAEDRELGAEAEQTLGAGPSLRFVKSLPMRRLLWRYCGTCCTARRNGLR